MRTVKHVGDEHYERMAAAEQACMEVADLLPNLFPVPRGMQAAGNQKYETVLSVNRLERIRRLVAKAVQCDLAELRPKEGEKA